MLSENQIRKRILSLTQRSWNRLYRSDLLDKEVDENLLLFMTRCQQCNKDPEVMIDLMIKKMKAMPNLAFCQAITFVFELKNYSSHSLNGWFPQGTPKIKRRIKL
jgi:hypothetical protein